MRTPPRRACNLGRAARNELRLRAVRQCVDVKRRRCQTRPTHMEAAGGDRGPATAVRAMKEHGWAATPVVAAQAGRPPAGPSG
mmetsp:Transcript_32698/g.98748  ORF Transcript_32698/g.98748 Transcript_32698/m.98748 type:complete len:83 (-) Transcript_32698:226-474(-)